MQVSGVLEVQVDIAGVQEAASTVLGGLTWFC